MPNENEIPQLTSNRSRRSKEVFTGDLEVGQRPAVDLDERLMNNVAEEIEPVQAFDSKRYVEDLAFMEQPVTIRLERTSEKHAPKVVECWNNGTPAEVFMNGQWVKVGYLPVGQVIMTKRKYVEILARAKHDTVSTEVSDEESENPRNLAHRVTSVKYPFSVVKDESPRGTDWLTRLLAEG